MELSHTVIQVWTRGTRCRVPDAMRAGVSLHSHTSASKEKLTFVPGLARRLPIVNRRFERSLAAYERCHGRPFDFAAAYWRPPLSAAAVIGCEREQIERCFDRPALVSVTDHDTFDGVTDLRASGLADVPLSLEWTVPFDGVIFHLGIHNLAPARLAQARLALAEHTDKGTPPLGDLLDWLGEGDDTLVVLNHPYWDLAGAGGLRHDSMLLAFLRAHRQRIHALELNGYRTWRENRRVLPLAEGFGLPVVSGGDRHGFAPNALLNLTPATSLSEFVDDLRAGHATHCVVLPEYLEPHNARVMSGAADLIHRSRNANGDGAGWKERVFVPVADGTVQPVGALWAGTPWLTVTIAAARLLGSRGLRPLFELTRADGCHTLEADCRADVQTAGFAVLDVPEPAGAS